jgi:hypothetical protein
MCRHILLTQQPWLLQSCAGVPSGSLVPPPLFHTAVPDAAIKTVAFCANVLTVVKPLVIAEIDTPVPAGPVHGSGVGVGGGVQAGGVGG